MKKKQPKWKPIKMGDRLPCQSFLRKKNGEILKLSTGTGIKVGQDAYYLPVDDVIEEIKNYPIEESEDEMICRKLIAFLKQCKAVYGDCFKQFGLDIDDAIAWLEKQSEPTEINPSEFDSQLNSLLKKFESLPKEELAGILNFYLNVVRNNGTYKEEKQGEQKIPKFKVGDVIRLKGSAAEYTIKKVTDATYYTNGWSCGIERCEEDYELVEQKSAWKPSEGQMIALNCAITAASDDLVCLNVKDLESLYEQLKKLREE